MRCLLLAPLAFAVACAPPDTTIDRVHDACEPLAIVPASGLTGDQSSSLADAVAMWNGTAGTRLGAEPTAGVSEVGLLFRSAAAAFFGTYDDEANVVIINQRIEERGARAVTLAHELGHVMGLEHVAPEERASVMNPANLTVQPTVEDRAQLQALWGNCAASAD